jgi:hypothetical protein
MRLYHVNCLMIGVGWAAVQWAFRRGIAPDNRAWVASVPRRGVECARAATNVEPSEHDNREYSKYNELNTTSSDSSRWG